MMAGDLLVLAAGCGVAAAVGAVALLRGRWGLFLFCWSYLACVSLGLPAVPSGKVCAAAGAAPARPAAVKPLPAAGAPGDKEMGDACTTMAAGCAAELGRQAAVGLPRRNGPNPGRGAGDKRLPDALLRPRTTERPHSGPRRDGGGAERALLRAIARVESRAAADPDRAVGAAGEHGRYQILPAYHRDATDFGGVTGRPGWGYLTATRDSAKAAQLVRWYWARYGAVTDEHRARLHNRGPILLWDAVGERYWRKVQAALAEIAKEKQKP